MKGIRIENEYARLKESQGYICIKVRHDRWAKDFFGLFDVIGFREDGGFLAQVKANGRPSQGEKLKSFNKHPKSFIKILAIKKDYKPFEEVIIDGSSS